MPVHSAELIAAYKKYLVDTKGLKINTHKTLKYMLDMEPSSVISLLERGVADDIKNSYEESPLLRLLSQEAPSQACPASPPAAGTPTELASPLRHCRLFQQTWILLRT